MKLLEAKGVPINVHDGARRNYLSALSNDGILSGFKRSCGTNGIVTATAGTLRIHGFRLEVYEDGEAITDAPGEYNTAYLGWNWLVLNITYDRAQMDSSYSFSCYPDYFQKDTDIESGKSGMVCRAIAKFKKSGSEVTDFQTIVGNIDDEMKVKTSDIDGWF